MLAINECVDCENGSASCFPAAPASANDLAFLGRRYEFMLLGMGFSIRNANAVLNLLDDRFSYSFFS